MSENPKPTVALTFDVELWNEGVWLKPHITEDMLTYDPFPSSMERILVALKKNTAHATFFVTLEVTEKYPEILRQIADGGHDIGIHGPRHIRLSEYTPETFKQDCEKQLSLIESAIGAKVQNMNLGFRAAHFSLDKKTEWMLPILKDLGFTYDSSIFPMNMGEYGVAGAPLDRYEIISGLTEIPTSVATIFCLRIPFAGGIYFRFLPFFIFKWFVNSVAKKRTPIIYFHPHELDANTPQIKSGPWLRRKLKYWGIKKSLKKFEALLKNFQCEKIL